MIGLVHRGKRSVRKMVLFTMAHSLGDGTIEHHYTGDRIRLHLFRHKGYWYHGKRRERATMERFRELIKPGDCVVEAGGHIGYISLYFAQLTGPSGSVHVFEPGGNNLPYVRANASRRSNVSVIEKALGREPGQLTMYVEDLTGQNNSLVPGFAGLESNQRNAIKAKISEQVVQVTTVDGYAEEIGINPNFIKIDVEGFEWEVLCGAARILKENRPTIMVEVQAHQTEIARFLHELDYEMYDDQGSLLETIPEATMNIFAIPTPSSRQPSA
jgi:FkbM family methyltransferase